MAHRRRLRDPRHMRLIGAGDGSDPRPGSGGDSEPESQMSRRKRRIVESLFGVAET